MKLNLFLKKFLDLIKREICCGFGILKSEIIVMLWRAKLFY